MKLTYFISFALIFFSCDDFTEVPKNTGELDVEIEHKNDYDFINISSKKDTLKLMIHKKNLISPTIYFERDKFGKSYEFFQSELSGSMSYTLDDRSNIQGITYENDTIDYSDSEFIGIKRMTSNSDLKVSTWKISYFGPQLFKSGDLEVFKDYELVSIDKLNRKFINHSIIQIPYSQFNKYGVCYLGIKIVRAPKPDTRWVQVNSTVKDVTAFFIKQLKLDN